MPLSAEYKLTLELGISLQAAKDLDAALVKLGAKYFVPLMLGDDSRGPAEDFAEWRRRVRAVLSGREGDRKTKEHRCGCGSKEGHSVCHLVPFRVLIKFIHSLLTVGPYESP